MFKPSRLTRWILFIGFVVTIVLLAAVLPQVGEAKPGAIAPSLATASSFAVLAGSTATNTGPTILEGDLGVWPGNSITGFPPGVVIPPGTIHNSDAVAQQAQSDVTTAYNQLAGQPCNFDMTGQDLGGLTLTPGVYCFPSTSAQLTGALTLNSEGDPSAVFVFQIGSTLTTASNASVNMINSGNGCNVFWQVGSSATLGTATAFKGNILALASITLDTSANIQPGRALARNAAVTMDTNTISMEACVGQGAPTQTPLASTATSVAQTQTAVVPTLTAIAATQTVVAMTPPPADTQTAVAATLTSVAATNTAIAPTLTAIAETLAPTLTAIAATQTATALTPPPSNTPTPTRTRRPTRTPTETRTPQFTRTPLNPTPTPTRTNAPGGGGGGGGGGNQPTPVIISTVVASVTPESVLPLLPTTGTGTGMMLVLFALGGIGVTVVGFTLLRKRR